MLYSIVVFVSGVHFLEIVFMQFSLKIYISANLLLFSFTCLAYHDRLNYMCSPYDNDIL